MRDVAWIALISVSFLISCGKDRHKDNAEPKPTLNISETGHEDGSDTQPKNESPDLAVPGLDEIKTSANVLCRTDESDGKEYCIDVGTEFPSDKDPEKKVKKCEHGMLDNDVCKKIAIHTGKGFFKVYAGDVLRAEGKATKIPEQEWSANLSLNLNKMKTSFDDGNGILSYDFPTKFSKSLLRNLHDSSIEIHPSHDIQISVTEDSDPVSLHYFGFSFETGHSTVEGLRKICEGLNATNADIIPWKFNSKYNSCIKDHGHASISMDCDSNDQHCIINDVTLDFFNGRWFVE